MTALFEAINKRNAFAYININKIEADGIILKDYVHETLAMAEASGYELGIVESRLLVAVIHLLDNELDQMLEILEGYTEEAILAMGALKIHLLYYDIHMLYNSEYKSDYDSAIAYARKEMAVAQALEDEREIIRIKLNMGTFLSRLHMEEASIEKLKEVIELMEESGQTDLISYALSNIAGSYLEVGNLALASLNADKAYEVAMNENHHVVIAASVRTMASVEKSRGNYPRAVELFHKSIELGSGTINDQEMYLIYCELNGVYMLQEDYDRAYGLLDKLEELLPYVENPWHSMEYYYIKSEVLKYMGRMDEAFTALKTYYDLSDKQGAKGKTEDWMRIRAFRARNL